MFGFKKKNKTWTAKAEDLAGYEEAYKKAELTLEELDEKLKPYKEAKIKGSVIISELYKRHGIKVDESWYGINDEWLDLEVINDLCVFNEQELAVLNKWIPKYKEARDAGDQMVREFYKDKNSLQMK